MQIKLRCPKCETALKVPAELSGKRGRCPKCQTAIVIPAVSNRPESEPTPGPISPPKAASAPATAPKSNENAKKDFFDSIVQSPYESKADRRRRLLEAFTGEIKPVRKSPAYVLAIPLVTLFMVLLPLAYVAFIVSLGYLVYYHAVNDVGMMSYGGHNIRVIFLLASLYAAPIVAGSIMVLFMLKPLLARPLQEGRTRSLTPQGEPILFDVVSKLCDVVGAPRPKRIDVDWQFNASAHFRLGFGSFLGNDLVLTIGAPLLACLSAQQFVGVLAHEFGHFSQGIGMRLSYVIRSINRWFARVVYERDQWDAWLSATAESTDFRIGWILALGIIGVAFSRVVLQILMMIGLAVSGLLLRQMEFDADRYEARVAGSETFEATTKRMRTFGAAYQEAREKFLNMARMKDYADDLSRLTTIIHSGLAPEILLFLEIKMMEEKTGLFDTHPCSAARIASAKREEVPGVFRIDGPASDLVCHFEPITRNVTWDLACALGLSHLKPTDLKPVEQLLASGRHN